MLDQTLPPWHPTALLALDESGSMTGRDPFFVLGGVKFQHPGRFARTVHEVRLRTGFTSEFKFAEITRGSLPAWFDLVDQLARSEARIVAAVVDRSRYDPFARRAAWEGYLSVASRLVGGSVNRRELVSVLLDTFSTPVGVAVDERLRREVNHRLRRVAVVTASSLDSRSTDLIQVADLVAGTVAFDRRQQAGVSGRKAAYSSPKGKVALRLMEGFGCPDFADQWVPRVRVVSVPPPRRRRGT